MAARKMVQTGFSVDRSEAAASEEGDLTAEGVFLKTIKIYVRSVAANCFG